MCKLIKSICCMLVLLCLFVSVPGSCSAAEQETITMSTSDYMTLKSNFQTLKANSEKQQLLLNQLKAQLTTAERLQNLSGQDWLTLKQQLIEAQNKTQLLESQLQTLEQQLTSAKQSSIAAENGLQSANQSLNELTKAIKKERAAAQSREFVLKIITAGALYYAATK